MVKKIVCDTSTIFDKLVPNRWENISLRNLLIIKHAVTEYLTNER